MGNIYLIRHGFTPANNAKYNNQRGINEIAEDRYMPLEREYGVEQAKEVGVFFKDKLKGKTIVFVSPYRRTLETFKYASSNMNMDLEVRVDERIREINSGVHYARLVSDIKKEFPESMEFFNTRDTDLANSVPFYGGECQNDLRDRVFSFALEIQNLSDCYDNILIFTHGYAMHWIFYWLNDGKSLKTDLKNCEIIKGNGDNAGESLFIPIAFAPKGLVIDIPMYKELVSKDKKFNDSFVKKLVK